ncbi:MAG: SdpI family protein [Planctomycetaceae bacterium]|nr:SdpI family protein [Planctomycetaceae bacterium]
MSEILLSIFFFVVCDLIFVAISIPLLLEKIGPNQWYGFRVEKTLDNREIWFKANKYMAKAFIVMGCIQIIYNIVLVILKTSDPFYIITGNLFFLTGGTLIVILASFLYLWKL